MCLSSYILSLSFFLSSCPFFLSSFVSICFFSCFAFLPFLSSKINLFYIFWHDGSAIFMSRYSIGGTVLWCSATRWSSKTTKEPRRLAYWIECLTFFMSLFISTFFLLFIILKHRCALSSNLFICLKTFILSWKLSKALHLMLYNFNWNAHNFN